MTRDKTLRLALEALEAMQMYAEAERKGLRICDEAITAIKKTLAQPEPEILGNVDYIPCCTDQTCPKCKPPQPKQDIPTMDDAIAAGDSVLMNEQAALLRECRSALDSLIQQKPQLAGLLCGSTTLGNLKASLYGYRPQGVFNPKEWIDLSYEEIMQIWDKTIKYASTEIRIIDFARSILKAAREKNT